MEKTTKTQKIRIKVPVDKLPLKLTKNQQEVFDACVFDNGISEIIACTGRQVGKTSVAQQIALYWSFENSGNKLGFFMPTFGQCQKVIQYFESINKIVGETKIFQINKSHGIIKVANGSTIQLLSGESKNKIRGFSFNQIIVDEACFIEDDTFNALILPTVTVSLSKTDGIGKMLLLSTPKSKNWFFKRIENQSSKLKLIRMTSEEGGFISREALADISRNVPTRIFRNEFLGEFLESGAGLFKYSECIDNNIGFDSKEKYVAAVDWGAQDDYTVLTVISQTGKVALIKKWRHEEYVNIINYIVKEMESYRGTQLFSETNGVGLMPTQELKRKYANTISVNTSNKSKVEVIQKLMLDFEQQNITIPDNPELLVELDNYEMQFTEKTKTVTYNAKKGYHDDMVMSLAIANYNRKQIHTGIRIFGG